MSWRISWKRLKHNSEIQRIRESNRMKILVGRLKREKEQTRGKMPLSKISRNRSMMIRRSPKERWLLKLKLSKTSPIASNNWKTSKPKTQPLSLNSITISRLPTPNSKLLNRILSPHRRNWLTLNKPTLDWKLSFIFYSRLLRTRRVDLMRLRSLILNWRNRRRSRLESWFRIISIIVKKRMLGLKKLREMWRNFNKKRKNWGKLTNNLLKL